MKYTNKMLAIGAMFMAVAACYGAEEESVMQQIYIRNKTNGAIRGGVYATTAGGRVLSTTTQEVQTMAQDIGKGDCRVVTIVKPQNKRTSQYHRLIFAKTTDDMTATDAIFNKINKDDGAHVFSTTITQLSGGKPLYYEVVDAKHLVTRKPILKIKKTSQFPCGAVHETMGQVRGTVSEWGSKVKRSLERL